MTNVRDEGSQSTEIDLGTDTPSADSSLGLLLNVLGFVLAIGAIYFLWARPMDQTRYANLHLVGALTLFVLLRLYRVEWDAISARERAAFVLSQVAVVGAIVGTTYVEVFYTGLQYGRYGRFTTPDLVAGALIILGILAATKLAYGWLITFVGVFTLVFAYFGDYFPGLLNHAGLSLNRVIQIGSIEFSGVYHFILQIGATWIFIFVIWAGIVEEFGGLESFIDIGFIVGGRFKSGIAQVATVSSMIMGSITGSPMANIVVTGSFTIPLMKERGIKSEVAAAIETVASTGGMVLPPVMGSVAFLMASFLDIPYGEVIVAAAVPAILFYVAIALSVHLTVRRLDIDMSVEREVDLQQTLKDFVPIFLSLLVLAYLLTIVRYPPGLAGVYTILALVAGEFLKRLVFERGSARLVRSFTQDLGKGLVTGSFRMFSLTIVLAMMGLVISTFNITGVGFRVALSIVNISGGNIVVLLCLVMISSIILGMGMPTPAAYLLTITLVAPAMVEVGFAEITAHFFVFYFAMLAALTPPVALAAAVAAKVGDADFYAVAFHSMKLATPIFILPFVFAFNQQLLRLDGLNTVATFLVVLVGYLFIAVGLNGGMQELSRYRESGTRVALFGVGLGLALFANNLTVIV
jgi:TRAP transporter 4TM/12TM fusion protein